MTLDRAQRRRGRQQPPGELSIYAGGRTRAGTILRRNGYFVALDAAGRELGEYATLRGACRAIPSTEIGGAA